jgi:putative Mn2+ efflux pump MntP
MIEWLQSLPAEWGNYISMLLFCSLGAMVWLIPIKAITADLESPRKWQDIRWWATVLIALQLCIYIAF